MSDEQVERKIRTYGHTGQIDHSSWLKWKWYGWTKSSRNLHPLSPPVWTGTCVYEGDLPPELADFPVYHHRSEALSVWDRILERIWDYKAVVFEGLKWLKGQLRFLR
jgi:hypothetical protein